MASQEAPPQPAYILRGHGAQVHSTAFIRSNSRLVTGDADGWIVVWSLEIKRPVAVWRAHEGAILGADAWGVDRLITHGKDNKLIVWKLSEEDEKLMSVVLPVDTPPEPRRQPWLLHMLHVNTMNFCSFAQTSVPSDGDSDSSKEILVAVPNTLTSETVDIFHFPSSERRHTVPNDSSFKGGMIMSISIFHHPDTKFLTVASGYESGHTSVSQLSSSGWKSLYISHPHTQPILSLSIDPMEEFYITSSADATIAKHPIPASAENVIMAVESKPLKILQTKHSGQQGLRIRSDGKVYATAGWDSKVRVYSTKSMKELAVLKWHKEGCYAVAFANIQHEQAYTDEPNEQSLEKKVGTMTVKEQRIWKSRNTHWIAAGSKDGKVSLWDIY
ncbi:WD repeat-containing protein [Tricladium varicosporioides]|nr:WD repeat-containing protein [Hymenoscyphus varicosporioides]